ncbi:MAG: PQQ-dependent sugar dehydrogenase [Coriobacteriia bacterium]
MPRAIVVALAVTLLAATAGCSSEPTPPVVVDEPSAPEPTATPAPEPVWPPEVKLTEAWSGFEQPVLLTHAGDGSGRSFVVELTGRVMVIEDGKPLPVPFLDIAHLVSTGGERGLFAIAFPPDFGDTGRFYVDYTDRAGDSVVARYRVSADPNVADPGSAEIILRVKQPFANHNGGQIAFGPDGYLYIGLGDGGSGGDPQNNGQNLGTLLGTILRVDVSTPTGYAVPDDNPFIGRAGAKPEIWDYGLRNPWRFSFDARTGDLYIADVGQNAWEELNVEPPGRGGRNYGWRLYEGTHPYPPGSDAASTDGLTMPVVEYPRDAGKSITGGFVYRGERSRELDGVYFYADYVSGRVWALTRSADGWRNVQVAETGMPIAGFGQDAEGEVYVLDVGSGTVYRIASR